MYDLIVVGGGPAGLTAALYAARGGKKVLILEEKAFGGQIATAPKVENFPSYNEISGADLAESMFNQAVGHGVEFDMGRADVTKQGNEFVVTTEYSQYTAKAIVLATGVTHKHLGIPSEERLAGNGVCYCAVCDGSFYAGKDVCVVGDGNSAAQYALYLAEICSSVHLLTLFDRLFCDKELADRIVANERIEWITNVSVTDILGDTCVEGIAFRDNDGAVTFLDTSAVFVAIGQQPNNLQFASLVQLDERGYIVADSDCKTSCEGVFAAGDCRVKSVRQCATAVGDGATAGFGSVLYVEKRK